MSHIYNMYVISKYRHLRNIAETVGERFLEREEEGYKKAQSEKV